MDHAEKLIADTYAAHGRCTLSCDCGDWECYIDADALDPLADTLKVAKLIEHARFDHITSRDVIATLPPIVVLDTRNV